ncbi:MAG: hypothetical protein A2Y33_16240 [Spirochaetes bacterium GWF1_51_8]|nr:MAG: hypothetical protein A2Y33_16240 [Spirochaetes bacterium GWF1_51_8]
MKTRIEELITFFDNNKNSILSNWNETTTRIELINPFFECLGWDVNNNQKLADPFKEVRHETNLKIGSNMKAPDYSFNYGKRLFYLEAKKPAVNIKTDLSPAYQLRRYGWTAKLPISILTDFEELAIYDCRIKPNHNDSAGIARIKYYTYKDYIDKWDEISGFISKDAVLHGSLNDFENKQVKGTASIDDDFLNSIEDWRKVLALNIAIRNPELTEYELNFSIQMIIDRIIFLRICEDRGIENYGLLKDSTNTDAYGQLLNIFKKADEKYNSGLFHFTKERERDEVPDSITPRLKIDDKALKDIIKGLYYPDCPYELSVISSDVLGSVYERFLGKVIRLTDGHHAKVEEKPEVRKAGGVYYTPHYIVEYIVKNTVGEKLKDIAPAQAAGLKILDPACGSGSFLIEAYQYLLDWHLDYYLNNDPDKWKKGKEPKIFDSPTGAHLTLSERKRILTNSIYGVDIDKNAVEVTKLSLLLKVLEYEGREIQQKLLFNERVLPDLYHNIKCGNSLIGSDFYTDKDLSLFGNDEMQKINTFDWHTAFPEVFYNQNSKLHHLVAETKYSRRSYRDNEPVIINDDERKKVVECIRQSAKELGFKVIAFNVLPDHFHLLIADMGISIEQTMRKIKGNSAFIINRLRGVSTEGEGRQGHIWSEGYSDTIVDNEEYLTNTMEYIRNNHIKHRETWGEIAAVSDTPPTSDHPATPDHAALSAHATPDLSRGLRNMLGMREYEYPAGGFDAVIGNPPYVRQELLTEKGYFQKKYEVYNGVADLYSYFIERGYTLLRDGGLFGIIVSNKWMRANYGQALRKWLKTKHIGEIVDFGDLPVFENATTYPCILSLTKSAPNERIPVTNVKTLEFDDLKEYTVSNGFTLERKYLADEGWTLADGKVISIMEKIKKAGIPLNDYVQGKIFYGIKTGLNEAFVIDKETRERLIAENPKSAEVIKPFLLGRDIKRYLPLIADKHLILFPKGWTNANSQGEKNKWDWLSRKYPAITAFLKPHENAAKKRYDQGDYWWELRACDYYEEFEKPKIIWPGISSEIAAFTFDDCHLYGNDNNQMIITSEKYLLGIINSKLSRLFLKSICDVVQGGFYRLKISYISLLPISLANTDSTRGFRDKLAALVEQMLEAQKQFHEAKSDNDKTTLKQKIGIIDSRIDAMVYELYGLNEEEIRIVEGVHE